MPVPSPDLTALFEPRGVVIVGASASPGKLGHAMTQSLESYPGRLRLVNPRPGQGMFGSISEAVHSTADIDLAVMCVPASVTANALRESADAGVRAALVCAGGFAEAGGAGAGYARELDEVVADTGIRLLGPNTSGFFVPGSSLFASFVPGVRTFGPGSVAVVAASGGINHVLSFGLQEEGAGVSLGVGLGAGQDITAPDVLHYLAGHEQTKTVILHVESVPDGRHLVDAVAELSAIKPVVALIVGRNDVAEFARSHTGALTTSWRIARGLLRQAGAVVVDDEAHAVSAAIALSKGRSRPRRASGIGLITGQAGPGLIIADGVLGQGWTLPPLSRASQERLTDLLPPITFQRNPVDTGRPGESFAEVVAVVGADPAIDIVGVYAIAEEVLDLPRTVADSDAEVPTVVAVDGTAEDVAAARRSAQDAGIAIVRGPTPLARALSALAEDARLRYIAGVDAGTTHQPVPEPVGGWDGEWDEIRAKDLLTLLGIRTPARRRCACRADAQAALAELGGPVAVKLVSSEVLHKSDIGGVILGVDSVDAMDAAIDVLESKGATEFLVEEMADAGTELVVGARRDEAFGPVVVVGLGGFAAEIIADVSIRSAPVPVPVASGMIDDLAAVDLLDGYRGAAAVDREELGRIISSLGTIVAAGRIAELEINPLRVTTGGLVALDAVVLPCTTNKERLTHDGP
jgi:acyl-CoA synthetase (NDP forming)